MNLKRALRGFSIAEALIAVVLMGILASIGYPILNGIIESGERKVVIARAEAMWAGQQTYLKRVANASSNWSAAATSEAKFILIRDFTPGASGLSLSAWEKYDYDYTLGANLNTRPTITDPDGANVGY
jgi:prepilin-type N-terminal cleavage/methylation domain-containing protein